MMFLQIYYLFYLRNFKRIDEDERNATSDPLRCFIFSLRAAILSYFYLNVFRDDCKKEKYDHWKRRCSNEKLKT